MQPTNCRTAKKFKRNQFVLRQRNQQPTPADFNQWIEETAEAHKQSTYQGRSGTSLSTAHETHQRNFNSDENQQFYQQPTNPNREPQQQQQSSQNKNNFSDNNNKNQYSKWSTTQMSQATRGSNNNNNNQPLPYVFNDGNHQLFHCPTFKAKRADERLQTVYQTFAENVIIFLKESKFRLTKWCSNSREFCQQMQHDLWKPIECNTISLVKGFIKEYLEFTGV